MKHLGVTVREILRLPVLARVISGLEGLDNIVRSIDTMEVPEIRNWLREGELLITTAYSIRNDPGLLTKLVEDLASVRAAAIAIKPERFIQRIPNEMIRVSNLHQIPIIEIPVGIPFIDITHAIMELIVDRQYVLLKRAGEIHENLTAMVLENRGLQAVTDRVFEILKSPVWILETTGELIVSSPQGTENKANDLTLKWDIRVDRKIVGRMYLGKESLDEMEQLLVDQARLVFSLELMRRKTAQETEKHLRGDFIDEILSDLPPSTLDVERRGRQLGMDPDLLWQVAVIEGAKPLEIRGRTFIASLSKILQQEAKRLGVRLHIDTRWEYILLFLPSKDVSCCSEAEQRVVDNPTHDPWLRVLQEWTNNGEIWDHGLRIGIGRKQPLWGLNKSYVEAKRALAISLKMCMMQTIVQFEDVEVYHIISGMMDSPEVDSLFQRKLGKLVEFDKEHNGDLLRTLNTYLESGGNVGDTAKRLYLHRNTVKYRLERIKEISDIDLSTARERFVYQFILTYYFLYSQKV